MTTPADTAPAPPPVGQAEWVTIPDPPAEHRSEPADDNEAGRGRPIGHWAVAGGSGAVLGSAGLFAAFGPVGLAAGAVTAVGAVGVYGYYKLRSRQQSPFGVRPRRERGRRTTSRLGSVGTGRSGKGPKLFGGGRGTKLGGRGGGPKLGKGAGKFFGGKGPKLGKGGGPKLGGKSGKLLGGKAGKFGGGRGSKLGGKLGSSRKGSTSRLGSVGRVRGPLARSSKAGLGFGARGGKLLGSKGKAGFGRWSKSTGAGAGVLGSKFGRGAKATSRKAGAAALRTKPGRQLARGFKAAKSALRSASPEQGRWSRWRQARRAARLRLGGKTWMGRFLAAAAAAVVATTAMSHDRWKARQEQRAKEKASERTATEPPAEKREPADGPYKREDVIHDNPKPGGPTVIAGTVIYSEYETNEPPSTARPAGTTLSPTMRSRMSQNPLAAAAQQVTAAAAAYRPQSMWVVDQDLEELHTVPLAIAEAVKIYTMTLQNNYPLHPAIVEALGRAYIALGEVSTSMQQTPGLFKQVHADDIRRKTAPRGDESKWNV